MTHCNYLTTVPSFDCIKYTPNNQKCGELLCWNEKGDKRLAINTPNNPTIMNGRLPHMVKKVNHYETTPRNNEHFPIYDVAYFHPDSQSINALSRDNKLPIEGYYPNRVLPNLMTHCNNSTTAPSFDCIKYTPKNPTIMIRPPHMVKKGTGGKRYDLAFYNHY